MGPPKYFFNGIYRVYLCYACYELSNEVSLIHICNMWEISIFELLSVTAAHKNWGLGTPEITFIEFKLQNQFVLVESFQMMYYLSTFVALRNFRIFSLFHKSPFHKWGVGTPEVNFFGLKWWYFDSLDYLARFYPLYRFPP